MIWSNLVAKIMKCNQFIQFSFLRHLHSLGGLWAYVKHNSLLRKVQSVHEARKSTIWPDVDNLTLSR